MLFSVNPPLWLYGLIGLTAVLTLVTLVNLIRASRHRIRMLDEDMRRVGPGRRPRRFWGAVLILMLAALGGLGYLTLFHWARTFAVDGATVRISYLLPDRSVEVPMAEVSSCTIERAPDGASDQIVLSTTSGRTYRSFWFLAGRRAQALDVVQTIRGGAAP